MSDPVLRARRRFITWLPLPVVVSACGGANTNAGGSGATAAAQDTTGSATADAGAQSLRTKLTGPAGAPWSSVGKGGAMIQVPSNGVMAFHLLVPVVGGVAQTLRRRNVSGSAWEIASGRAFGTPGTLEGVCQTFSADFQHVEAVAVDGGRVRSFWREVDGPWNEIPGLPVGDAQGYPALVQTRLADGSLRLEVVVGLKSGGMAHFVRDPATIAWREVARFGGGNVRGVSMIQSNFVSGGMGNLELVAWVDDRAEHYWCAQGKWSGPSAVIRSGDVSGCPALIQSNWWSRGNFELLLPVASGGMVSYFRNNNDGSGFPWYPNGRIGNRAVAAATLLQGPYGNIGNFEVAAILRDPESGATASVSAGVIECWYRDDAGNWNATGDILAAPFGDPASFGRTRRIKDIGVVGIHSTMLKDGSILTFGFPQGGAGNPSLPACVWNPVTDAVTPVPNFRNNFCAGQTQLADGKVLIVGGHIGDTLRDVVVFDPDTRRADLVQRLPTNRWYPTVVSLDDGRALILGGSHIAGWSADVENTWQVYRPGRGLAESGPIPVPFSRSFPAGQSGMDLYPQAICLPDRRVFVHARNTTRFFQLDSMTWSDTQLKAVSDDSRTYPFMGGLAMLPLRPSEGYRVRIVVAGGRAQSAQVAPGGDAPGNDQPGLASAEMLDLGATTPAWKSIAPLNEGRSMADLLTLPDGTLLMIGGNRFGRADVGSGPTLQPELYDPVTNTWTSLAATRIPRGYHATALLLPDGAVAILGKDGDFQGGGLQYAETRVEIFDPPYLFKGARPVIQACPSALRYGQPFDLDLGASTSAADIRSVVLVSTGSATHQVQFSQRVVELVRNGGASSRLQLVAPPNGFIAPAGFYHLFLIGANGVPSVSVMIQLTGAATLLASVQRLPAAARSDRTVSLDQAGAAPKCDTPDLAQDVVPLGTGRG